MKTLTFILILAIATGLIIQAAGVPLSTNNAQANVNNLNPEVQTDALVFESKVENIREANGNDKGDDDEGQSNGPGSSDDDEGKGSPEARCDVFDTLCGGGFGG